MATWIKCTDTKQEPVYVNLDNAVTVTRNDAAEKVTERGGSSRRSSRPPDAGRLPTTCQPQHPSSRRRNRRKRRQASRQSGSNQRPNCNGRRPLLCFLERNQRSRPPPRRRSRKAPRVNPRRLRQSRRGCLVAGPKHRHPDVFRADVPAAELGGARAPVGAGPGRRSRRLRSSAESYESCDCWRERAYQPLWCGRTSRLAGEPLVRVRNHD
jgi:hypothetical protein